MDNLTVKELSTWLTTRQTAEKIGVPVYMIAIWREAGTLEAIRIAGHWLYNPTYVDRLIQERDKE